METADLIKLITAVVIEVMKQMDEKHGVCAQSSGSTVKQQEHTGNSFASKPTILTLHDVKTMLDQSQGIVLKRGDRLTSLAADYIKDNKLEVRAERG